MWKVNAKRLPLKAHYFFFLAAMGPILPFIPVIGKQFGISEVVMGGINAVLPIFFIVVKPVFGYLIDYFVKERKVIFMTLLAATSVSFTLMMFIPRSEKDLVNKLQCDALQPCQPNIDIGGTVRACSWACNETTQAVTLSTDRFCLLGYNSSCPPLPDDGSPSDCVLSCTSGGSFYSGVTFWMFVVLVSIGTVGYNVSNSISDAICFDVLGEGQQMEYGQQRVWGTIGFGLTALLAGFCIDYISTGAAFKDYTPAYLIVTVCMLFDLVACYKLTMPPLGKTENILKDVGTLVRQPHIFTFLVFATLVGVCDSAMIYYLLWFLEDLAEKTGELENIKLLEGLTVAGETLFGEVIFFPLAGRVLAKVGYAHCLSLCFAFYALRLGMVSLLTSPWWVLPIECVMQGPTYALCYTTIVAYASAVSPPGTSGTVQGIVAGMDDGLGYSVGSIVGGVLYRLYGGKVLFMSYAGMAAMASLSHYLLYINFFRNSIDKPIRGYKAENGDFYEMTTLKRNSSEHSATPPPQV